ncbi:hypothetical protein XENORESO_004652 [Xenotaenia resolanae]|uniref:Uncharacterized protein n=1 Tax=Xenotaenia resolanae TaxID=208358 RepID=A0ABV0W6T0_9TELE
MIKYKNCCSAVGSNSAESEQRVSSLWLQTTVHSDPHPPGACASDVAMRGTVELQSDASFVECVCVSYPSAPQCVMGRREADRGSVVLWVSVLLGKLWSQKARQTFRVHRRPQGDGLGQLQANVKVLTGSNVKAVVCMSSRYCATWKM